MKAVFMGTPEIAAVILRTLLQSGIEIAAVVTKPDKPKGRGKEMAFSAVKQEALSYGLPIYQPEKVKEEGFLQELKRLAPDVILVAAYGKILPETILSLPPYGCVNVHASLLPKYRGVSPIQWAVIDGEKKSGVTIIQMNAGIDTGDILLKKEICLEPKETAQSLHDKLAVLGGSALLEVLKQLEAGTAVKIPQEENGATYVGMIEKAFGQMDFEQTATELERLIRGLNPWPGAYAKIQGKTIKFWDADVCSEQIYGQAEKVSEGTVAIVEKEHFYIQCKNSLLQINELQPEGKKRMTCAEFLRGYPMKPGIKFEPIKTSFEK